jgi:hypothetical protein
VDLPVLAGTGVGISKVRARETVVSIKRGW